MIYVDKRIGAKLYQKQNLASGSSLIRRTSDTQGIVHKTLIKR